MPNAKTEATNAWMERNEMQQVNTAVPRELIKRFDTACQATGASRREVLLSMMEQFAQCIEKSANSPLVGRLRPAVNLKTADA